MNKGYAFGFLVIILVVILGLYVAFTGFMSSREALRAQPVAQPNTRTVQDIPVVVDNASPTATPTTLYIPTPLPAQTITPTLAIAVAPTEAAAPTEPPAPGPTNRPPQQATVTPAPPAQPPTPIPAPAFQFRLGGPPSPDASYPNCCYIFGVVRDAAGNGMERIQVQAFNEWNTLPPATTKGGGEAGQYNIPIGRDTVTWYVVVVDAAGNHISTQTPVAFDPGVAGGYRVDWQRTY